MALKQFHIVLISAAILQGLFFAFWEYNAYTRDEQLMSLALAVLSFLVSVCLFVYLLAFLKKAKDKGW